MKSFILFGLLWLLTLSGYSQRTIYVSPTGSNAASGTESSPFKTLAKAQEKVRELKKSGSEGITVILRGGIFSIDKTLVFGLEDGGNKDRLITWKAYPGETPVLSSGIKLTGWTRSKKLKGVPEAAKGKVFETSFPAGMQVPRSLFDGDEMLRRSRSKGFKSRIDAFGRDGQAKLRAFNIMYVNERAELKNWDNVQDMELVIRPWCLWNMNNLPIESIDLKNRSIKTSVSGTYFLTNERYDRFPAEHAWIENCMEGMTEPGTWCINSKLGKVYYWPKGEAPGENIMIPSLQEFIRIEGFNDIKGRNDIPVRNLVFKGLSFKHNDRYILKDTDAGTQHDWELFDTNNAFFRFRGAEDCLLEECEFSSGGGAGVRLDLYCKNITVRNNYIHGIGATGIVLCGYGLGTRDVNTKNIISNNKITDVSRLVWHSSGITLSQTSENVISHNQISKMPYCGMVITGYRPGFMHESKKNFLDGTDSLRFYNWHGGPASFVVGENVRECSRSIRWDEVGKPIGGPGGGPKVAMDNFINVASYFNMNHNRMNLIENNEIFDIMKYLGDGNGIYISDTGPFNVIRNNFIHSTPNAWGVGIRTDAFQMNTYVYGNIIWKFAGGIASTANNLAYNNIVASCPQSGMMEDPGKRLDVYFDYMNTAQGFTDCMIMRNVIWHEGKRPPYFRLDLSKNEKGYSVVDHNFYFWKDHATEMKEFLSVLRQSDIDKNGMIMDPMFADPEHGNFQIDPRSPLLKNGFAPIDQKSMGLSDSFPVQFLNK